MIGNPSEVAKIAYVPYTIWKGDVAIELLVVTLSAQ
jgi:hypothetical protein